MKKSKGNVTIIVIIAIIVILILAIVGLFVYQHMIATKDTGSNTQMPTRTNEQLNVDTENNQTNSENTQENNTLIDKTFNIIPDGGGDTGEVELMELSSTKYYYNQLDSNAKIIYDKLKKEKNSFKTGNHVFDFGTEFNTLLHTDNGKETLKKAFSAAIDAFVYDDCELFYVDPSKLSLVSETRSLGGIDTYYISIGAGSNPNYLRSSFQTKESIEEAQKYLDGIVNQIVEQTKQDTDLSKAKKVHDWLIGVVNYGELNTKNHGNIYGTIHDKTATCEGYARSFKYIMEKVGVPTILVTGTAKNSEGKTEAHAWNYIQIDQAWFAIDLTWDDPVIIGEGTVSEEQKYKYFLKGADEFFADHTESKTFSENGTDFSFPIISGSSHK